MRQKEWYKLWSMEIEIENVRNEEEERSSDKERRN